MGTGHTPGLIGTGAGGRVWHASSAGLFGPREADRSSEGQREINKRTPLGPTVSDFTHSKFYRPVAAMVKALVQPDGRDGISMPAL